MVGRLMVVSKHLLNPNPATVLVVLLCGLWLLLNFDKKDTDNKIHTLLFINIKHQMYCFRAYFVVEARTLGSMVVVVMAQGLQIFYIWSKFAIRGSYFFSSLLFCHFMSILSSSFFDIHVLLGNVHCWHWQLNFFDLVPLIYARCCLGASSFSQQWAPKSWRRPCLGPHSIVKSHSILEIHFLWSFSLQGHHVVAGLISQGPYFV